MQRQFGIQTEIFFGPGCLERLEQMEMKRVCIVTDASMVKFGLVAPVEGMIRRRNIPVKVFDKVKPDPTLSIVTEGVRHLVENKPDVVIALGGGSVIDTAKAIIYLDLRLQEKILRKEDVKKTGLVAIPTTSGTGSEVTSYAVITNEEAGRKIPLMDNRMIPDVAILDSNFTKTLPPFVIAHSGLDVFTHALEAYVSRESSPFSRAYAVEALQLVRDHLYPMFLDVTKEEHRTHMHIASCLGGLAFQYSSLGLNHGMAHAIGGEFHLPHGLCNAILLSYIVGFNAGLYGRNEVNEEVLNRYAEVAELFGVTGESPRRKVLRFIEFLREQNEMFHVPNTFKEAGIHREDYFKLLPSMVRATMEDGTTAGNPVAVTAEDVEKMYRKVYGE